jgi:hypothetical protein
MIPEDKRNWTKLPLFAEPFPSTRTWCWELADYETDEVFVEQRNRVHLGTLYLGSNGGGIY